MKKSRNPFTSYFGENKRWRLLSGMIRVGIVALAVMMQVALVIFITFTLQEYSAIAFLLIEVAAAIIALFIISSPNLNSSSRIAWLFLMIFVPIIGAALYLLWGNVNIDRRERGFIEKSFNHGNRFLRNNLQIRKDFQDAYPHWLRLARYLDECGFPMYQGTDTRYYPLGELWLEALLEDLEKAEHFIFIEMFIVEDGTFWRRVFDVLQRKAAQGVKIRFMYDDMGSLLCFSNKDAEYVRSFGIDVQIFNKVQRNVSSLYINYRNHQKIVVIDGDVGYVGGSNFADEYANYYPKHGHWKDVSMRMEGDATWSLTVFFLQMWDLNCKTLTEDYDIYRPRQSGQEKGFYVPMVDGPANNPHNPGLDMYKLLIANAQDYCYITTPYLVLDSDMVDSLCLAARSGVDLRIIVPHIPDHWYVHVVTQSFYKILMSVGVRIYEYTPGYIHSKTVLVDDEIGVIGSINMDFRSFYLHYEDAVLICDSPILSDMKEDFLYTIAHSQEIELEKWLKRPWPKRFMQMIMRIFAPML